MPGWFFFLSNRPRCESLSHQLSSRLHRLPLLVADVSSAPWPGPGSGASPFVSERRRSFLRASMTLIFERRVANLTNRGRRGGGEPSDDGLGLPTRWDTDILSRESGGTSFILELQRRNTLSSVDPLVSSDMPNMRTESRRPCCSWSSMAVCRWLTSCCKFWISPSFSANSDLRTETVLVRVFMVSFFWQVMGSQSALSIGSNISLNRSITSASSRTDKYLSLKSSIALFWADLLALASISLTRLDSPFLAGSTSLLQCYLVFLWSEAISSTAKSTKVQVLQARLGYILKIANSAFQ